MIAVALYHFAQLLFKVSHECPREALRVDLSRMTVAGGGINKNLDVWNLLPHQDSELVASLQDGGILRIVGSAYEVCAHFLHQPNIPDSNHLGHCIAEKPVILPPVDTVQIDGLAVQCEAGRWVVTHEADSKCSDVAVGSARA